jgi:hypothetical protein
MHVTLELNGAYSRDLEDSNSQLVLVITHGKSRVRLFPYWEAVVPSGYHFVFFYKFFIRLYALCGGIHSNNCDYVYIIH